MLFKDSGNVLGVALFEEKLTAALAGEGDDGNPPGSLAGDAPVRPVLDHAIDPVMAPVGNPFHPVDLGQSFPAEIVLLHGDEPLLRGAEDDRVLAAPAVGVLVLVGLGVDEGAHLLDFPDDGLVGVEDELAGEECHVRGEPPLVIHGGVDGDVVFQPRLVVLLSVAGSGVNAAGSGVEGDVIRQDENRFPVDKGMAAF